MTHSRTRIHDLLGDAGLAPRRDLGQNFVADPNTVRRIAALAKVGAGDHVVEIGAGLGSLTLALAETGAAVTAVEVDRGIVPVLREVVADLANVRVVEADATTADWSALLAGSDDWTLVANLPYNVATPLVCDLLDDVPAIRSMLVMVQREVAERIAAPPGSKQYGAVSVKVAYWAKAAVVGLVPASVFVPRPNVESALVRIDRREPPPDRPHAAVPPRAHELRSTAQDAAPIAGRRGDRRGLCGRRCVARGTTRAARPRRVVPAHRRRGRAGRPVT